MLKQRAKLVATAHVLTDAGVVAAAFMAAHWIRSQLFPDTLPDVGPLRGYAMPMAAATVIFTFLFFVYRLYGSFRTVPFRTEAARVTKSVATGAALLFAINFITKFDKSRSLLFLFLAIAYTLLLAERLAIRMISGWIRERGYNYRTVLIIGTGPKAREFARIIHDHRHWGLKLLGFVAEDPLETARSINGYDVLGAINDMPEIIHKHVLDEVVMVVPRNRLEDLEDTFLLCEEAGIKTRIAVSMFPHLIAKVDLEEMQGVPLITFSTTPTNELSLVIKRALDVVIATLILVLTSPIMMLAAIGIKLDSEGPVLFRQVRIGLQGRKFVLYKFRSMVEDAAAMLKELQHLNEMDGPVFKMKDDPRVTRVGRVIRRYSIDELPQLFNVLKGDMCIVGPRPPMPEEVESYERWQKRRLSMKPGLTCLWQVNGRNKIPFGEWMKLDLAYIDNWSLWLDLKILLRTIPQVLLGRGAS